MAVCRKQINLVSDLGSQDDACPDVVVGGVPGHVRHADRPGLRADLLLLHPGVPRHAAPEAARGGTAGLGERPQVEQGQVQLRPQTTQELQAGQEVLQAGGMQQDIQVGVGHTLSILLKPMSYSNSTTKQLITT